MVYINSSLDSLNLSTEEINEVIIALYSSKKELKSEIGNSLKFQETSFFGPEYKPDGSFCVSNRPSLTGIKGREFFAEVTMKGGLIYKVT